jgi:predicted PurR-regulated permease PerM
MDLSRRFYTVSAALILFVFILALYITKEFITAILLSVFLTYVLNPVYRYLLQLTGKKSISSALSLILVFLIFVFIIISAIGILSTEVSFLLESEDAYMFVSNFSATASDFVKSSLPEPIAVYVGQAGGISTASEKYLPPAVAYYLEHVGEIPLVVLSMVLPILQSSISGFLADLPIRFAQFLVAIFFTYYFLIDGKEMVCRIVSVLPERDAVDHFLKELNSIYNNLFNVYFITSILSGIFAAVGFALIGTPYPVLLGALIAILTLIPMVGPIVVFLPMSVYYLLVHDYFKGVVILVFGIVVLTIIPENVLRPRLAMKGASIHPIITILAYTAPIFVVGIMGVVIGPALYGFLLAAYRTAIYLRLSQMDDNSVTSIASPSIETELDLPQN